MATLNVVISSSPCSASGAPTSIAESGLATTVAGGSSGGAATSIAERGLGAAGRGGANRAPTSIAEGLLLCQRWRNGQHQQGTHQHDKFFHLTSICAGSSAQRARVLRTARRAPFRLVGVGLVAVKLHTAPVKIA